MNAGDKGEWAKLIVEAALLSAGAEVYRAVSPAASVQLLVVHPLPWPVRHSRVAVRTALLKPTKDDSNRLAFVGRAPTDCDVVAFATPGGQALFTGTDEWWRASGLNLCQLDGPTILTGGIRL